MSKQLFKVAQPFCVCGHRGGYGLDPKSGLQVCGCCGFPRKEYYIVKRSAMPPGRPMVYSDGSASSGSLCNKRPVLP